MVTDGELIAITIAVVLWLAQMIAIVGFHEITERRK